jgi:acyl carrier protein
MIATTERALLIHQVIAIVRKAAKLPAGAAITPESRLVEDLMIDSLDLVSLVLQVQDHFDVVIEEEAVPNLRSVADLAGYLAMAGNWHESGDGPQSRDATGLRGVGDIAK